MPAALKVCEKKSFSPPLLGRYLDYKSNYKSLIGSKKTNYRDALINNLNRFANSSTFWKTIRSFRSRMEDQVTIEPEIWFNYFKDHCPTRVHSLPFNFPDTNEELERTITLEKITQSLNRCKPRKSLGAHGIPSEFYAHLPPGWILYLSNFFNRILDKEEVPPSWGPIHLRMLFKSGDRSLPINYRPW